MNQMIEKDQDEYGMESGEDEYDEEFEEINVKDMAKRQKTMGEEQDEMDEYGDESMSDD